MMMMRGAAENAGAVCGVHAAFVDDGDGGCGAHQQSSCSTVVLRMMLANCEMKTEVLRSWISLNCLSSRTRLRWLMMLTLMLKLTEKLMKSQKTLLSALIINRMMISFSKLFPSDIDAQVYLP